MSTSGKAWLHEAAASTAAYDARGVCTQRVQCDGMAKVDIPGQRERYLPLGRFHPRALLIELLCQLDVAPDDLIQFCEAHDCLVQRQGNSRDPIIDGVGGNLDGSFEWRSSDKEREVVVTVTILDTENLPNGPVFLDLSRTGLLMPAELNPLLSVQALAKKTGGTVVRLVNNGEKYRRQHSKAWKKE